MANRTFRLPSFKSRDYSLSFPEINTEANPKNETDTKQNSTVYSIIIGANGCGKSRLLGHIASNYRHIAANSNDQGTLLDIKGNLLDRDPPERLLAVSNLASDTFPFSQNPTQPRMGNDPEKYKDERYFYLGVRQNHNMTTTGSLSRATRDNLLILHASRKGYGQLEPVCRELSILPDFRFVAVPANQNPLFPEQDFQNSLAFHLVKFRMTPKQWQSPKESYEQALTKKNGESWLKEHPNLPELYQLYRELQYISQLARNIYQGANSTGPSQNYSNMDKWESSSEVVETLINLGEKYSIDIVELVRICSRSGAFDLIPFFHLDPSRSVQANNKVISIDDLSTGEQLLLSMVARIIAHIVPGSLILIDEPEVGMHPNWQSNFIPLLRQTIPPDYGCHFLIATHSPFLVADGTDLLVPGTRWGTFEPYPDPFYGRSVQNILYRVFHTRISGNLLVEEDLRFILEHIGNLKNHSINEITDRYWRLKSISGPDTIQLNSMLDEARNRLGLPDEKQD